jgi:hypothetical protein
MKTLFFFACLSFCMQVFSQTIKGRLYFRQEGQSQEQQTAKGKKYLDYPAAYHQVFLVPNTSQNLIVIKKTKSCSSFNTRIQGAISVYTDSQGFYVFEKLKPGEYLIRVCDPVKVIWLKVAKSRYVQTITPIRIN